MKIVFITPASDIRRLRLYRMGNMLYGHSNAVTGPLILGQILKEAGYDVSVYEELYKDIDYSKINDVDFYCIYTMTSNATRAYFLADKLHEETKARVIIGGMHATVMPEEALIHADQIVIGEAETVILDIVEGKITDKIVHANYLKNLDDAPFPDYSMLKTPCECANVMTTRGCPFSCSFCSTSRMFYPYRERSINSVIDELKSYKDAGFKYVNFEDDNFTANKERVKEICRRMIAEGLVFNETFFFGRIDLAKDVEMLELLQKAGITRVLIGIESLNQESLDLINKHQNVSDIERCAETLSRYKIRLIASIVLGIDTDDKNDLKRSIDFAKKINAYQLQPAILTPFPGTPLYEQYERENRIISKDWEYFDMMHVNFLPKKMTSWELQKQFLIANWRFYSFFSAFKIGKRFGINFGLRRLGLWFLTRIATLAALFSATFIKGTQLYKLKHMKDKLYGEEK